MSKQLTAVAMLALMAGTALANPRESQAGPSSLNINGATITPDGFSLNFLGHDGGGNYQAQSVTITGTQNSNYASDWLQESHMTVTPPGGATVDVRLNAGAVTYTTMPVEAKVSLGGAVPSNGTWTFSLYNDAQDNAVGADAILTDCVITLDDAPPVLTPGTSFDAAIDLGTLVDGTDVSATVVVPAAGVVWYKFNAAEASGAAGRKLSMGTLNSTDGNSELCIYRGDTGTGLYYSDDENGTLHAFLSFGSGGLAGNLDAGEYYLAVGSYFTSFFLDHTLVSSTGPGGTFQLDVIQEDVGQPVPPSAIDLGTLVDGVNVTQQVSLPAATVAWYKATVDDCSDAANRELIITTGNSDPFAGDTLIGVYSDTGAAIAIDDDTAGNLLSELTFGKNGFDGDLIPGTYYIPVATYETTFYIQGWNVFCTGDGGDFQLDVLQTNSFPATATASAASVGNGLLFRVTVTPGTNPDSTGITVQGDLSSLGGSATQVLFDDGTHGDATAGDHVFSYLAPTPSGGSEGQVYAATYTVTDDQSDNLTGDMSLVFDANSSIATATVPSGTGTLDSISDNFDFDGDVDMYKITICDPGSFSASTIGGTTEDTKLYLFNTNGTGVTSNDDDPAQSGSQSIITGAFVPASGDYYLAVTRYPVQALDASGNEIWQLQPFDTERQPDGPLGMGNPLASWDGAGFGTAAYTVTFTGTCYPTTTPTQCSVADVGTAGGLFGHDHHLDNNDFISFIGLFFAQSPIADMGSAGGLAGSDGAWNNNDFIAFINHFFADTGACNGG